MKGELKIGQQFSRHFIVEPRHLITFADARMPAVLATPHLLAEMEFTARDAVAPLLETHQRTVGTEIEIKHLAPSIEGFEVVCFARVLGFDGSVITFQVEARDEVDLLARGIHRRAIIDVDRLRKRIERKRQQATE